MDKSQLTEKEVIKRVLIKDVKGWNPDFESIEDFLNSVGHNVNNCEWMVHSDHQVISRDAEWTRFPITK